MGKHEAAGPPLHGRRTGDVVREDQHGKLHAAAHVQLLKDGGQMVFDRLLGDPGGRGDVTVAEPPGDRRDDFPFAMAEAVGSHA